MTAVVWLSTVNRFKISYPTVPYNNKQGTATAVCERAGDGSEQLPHARLPVNHFCIRGNRNAVTCERLGHLSSEGVLTLDMVDYVFPLLTGAFVNPFHLSTSPLSSDGQLR